MPSYFFTGCNRGLGLEFIRQLAASSSNLVIGTTRRESSELNSISAHHSNFHILTIDITKPETMSTLLSQISTILGSPTAKLDFLVNNAGVNIPNSVSILALKPSEVQTSIMTNVLTPAEIVKTLQPHLQEGSVVLNMTSGVASMSRMLDNDFQCGAPYAISKAAVNMITVMQANALKEKGVVVFCMDPGHVKTDMGGEGAVLEPEESIGGMLKVLGGIKKGDEGKYLLYDGSVVPW